MCTLFCKKLSKATIFSIRSFYDPVKSDAIDSEDIPICWSDVYVDGDVDGEDLSIFIKDFYYNNYPCTFDFDGDGDVDDLDMLFFCEDFSRTDCAQ